MNRRDEIIKVALRIASERGYEWLSFQKVADEVGIAKSSVYHYFRKKEDLGIAVMEIVLEEIRRKERLILTYKTEKERLEAFNSQPERVAWRARIPIMDFNELR